MEGNQHNDNLEQFFKANLERYSPQPSPDFWERMEAAIPPKPTVWGRWASAAKRWGGLAVLLLAVATVAVLWRSDRAELAKVTAQLDVQQLQLEAISQAPKPVAKTDPVAAEKAPALETGTTAAPSVFAPAGTLGNTDFAKKGLANQPGKAPETSQNGTFNQAAQTSATASKTSVQTTENQLVEHEEGGVKNLIGSATAQFQVADEAALGKPDDFRANTMAGPTALALLVIENSQVLSLKKHALTVKQFGHKPNRKSYPRISAEVGTSVFAMPISRLYSGDTLYAGRVRPSFSAGFLLNYETNPSTAFQGGYIFKEIRTSRVVLRYNSFPMMVVKKWAWSRNLTFEGRTGLTINSLLNVRTSTDGLSVRGLKTTWLGLQGSVGFGLRVSDQVTLLAGPSFGWALTPVANQKRTWEAGIGANLRYQF